MNIMGIDQSLTGTGISIWNGDEFIFSIISSEKSKGTKAPTIDYTRRLIEIVSGIEKLIVENNIELVAMEGMSFGSRGSTVFDLGGLSHLIRAKLVELNVDFIVIPPKTLKKYWTGKGNANKDAMIEECMKREYDIPYTKNYGTKKKPDIKFDDNVVDAHALCVFLKEFSENKLEEYKSITEDSREVFYERN